jgi:hypothetical protein
LRQKLVGPYFMASKKSLLLIALTILVALVASVYFLCFQGDKSNSSLADEPMDGRSGSSSSEKVLSESLTGTSPRAESEVIKSAPSAALGTQQGSVNASVNLAGRKQLQSADSELTTAGPVGEKTIARVINDGKERVMTPNEIGHFPRIYLKPKQEVPVEVSFPDAQAAEPVVVQVEDGGSIDGDKVSKGDVLDDAKKVAFKFRANADEGIYHVVLRKGADSRVLDFWVGDELPVVVR